MRTFSIINETRLHSGDLRNMVKKALRWNGVAERGLITEVRFGHIEADYVQGWAWTDDAKIEVLIPERFEERPRRLLWIAQTLTHEIHHMMGLDHRDMIPVDRIKVPWLAGVRLRVKQSIGPEK